MHRGLSGRKDASFWNKHPLPIGFARRTGCVDTQGAESRRETISGGRSWRTGERTARVADTLQGNGVAMTQGSPSAASRPELAARSPDSDNASSPSPPSETIPTVTDHKLDTSARALWHRRFRTDASARTLRHKAGACSVSQRSFDDLIARSRAIPILRPVWGQPEETTSPHECTTFVISRSVPSIRCLPRKGNPAEIISASILL